MSQAYRQLPMHVHWQVRQVMEIDGVYHMDCNHSMAVCIVHAALLTKYSSDSPYKQLIFHGKFLVGGCE